MAVRQYIGARYVPTFSDVNGGVWDNTNTYEPLTIVKYNNDFYTSKREVPTGIEITNTIYWVQTGNSNGAIIDLQNQIDDLNESKITDLQHRKYIFCVDSFDVQYSVGFITGMCNKLGISSDDYIKVGSSAFGFIGNGEDKDWLGALQTAAASIPDKSIYTDIIIFGGTNDYAQTKTDIQTAMTAFDTYVKANFTNAHISLAPLINMTKDDTWVSNTNKVLSAYKPHACNLGWTLFKNTEFALANHWHRQSTDDLHPNESGCAALSYYMAQAMLTGTCDVSFTDDIALTASDGVSFTSVNAVLTFHNGDVGITIPQVNMTLSGTFTPFTGWILMQSSNKNITYLESINILAMASTTPLTGYLRSQTADRSKMQFLMLVSNQPGSLVLQRTYYAGHPII